MTEPEVCGPGAPDGLRHEGADARRSRAVVAEAGAQRANGAHVREDQVRATLAGPLPAPGGPAASAPPPVEIAIDPVRLAELRRFVADHASGAGLPPGRVEDLVLAVNEVVVNSVIHGGGGGVLRAWTDGDSVVHEVRDGGHIDEPLVGRRSPSPGQTAGRGLWVVDELCDLVQRRSTPAGTVVRLHMTGATRRD